MFLTKSPYSLPPEDYGGGRKRIFIGLIGASCLLVCLALLLFVILPWLPPLAHSAFFSLICVATGAAGIGILAWLCLTLIFHIYTGRTLPGLSWVRHAMIRLFLPLMVLLARPLGIERNRVLRSFVKVNNELVLAHARPIPASRLLLLLPHCVQGSQCLHRLAHDVDNCARCGKCPISELLALRDKYGIILAIASGGSVARRIVVRSRALCIVAVACERDLASGIQDTYPLPVFGVLNRRPAGPCVDTLVPFSVLESGIRFFLGLSHEIPFVSKSPRI